MKYPKASKFVRAYSTGHLETDFLVGLLNVNRKINIRNRPWLIGYQKVSDRVKNLTVALASNCSEILVWHTKRLNSVWVNGRDDFEFVFNKEKN